MLKVDGITVRYPGAAKDAPAVEDASFFLQAGGSLGIAGESGCGKSTIAKAILGILPPESALSGSIRYGGAEIANAPERRLRALRGAEISMVFQDPSAALNPVRKIRRQFYDILGQSGKNADDTIEQALLEMRLPDPRRVMEQYPPQLSGGMKQRVVIAAAMLKGPRLLIADEPTSAIDAAVRAQIIDEFIRLRQARGIALLYISHDLAELRRVCDDLLVMKNGRVIESGNCADILSHPAQSYTKTLLEASEG